MLNIRAGLLVGAALWANAAIAAESLKFGPPPAWVHPQDVPAAKQSDAPISILLTDEQIAFEPGKLTVYNDGAMKIQNAQGLAAGNLSVVWQPATDTVTVNKLIIRRGDKVIDVLASGQTFTTLRRETNLDAATLDGTLTATIQPEGLQEGDVIELATTTERVDPVLKGHVETMFGAWDGLPVQSAHAILKWPSKARVNFRETANLPVARRSSANGINVLELSAQNLDPLVAPTGAPQRFQIGRLAEATDYASWSDVADLMMPLFRDASAIRATGPLGSEIEKIRSASGDAKTRAALALALVQDRVRYVALLMGQGGYVPASAEQTWSRRFGDCKAKTALLLGILHSLGIDAEPVLVQTKAGDMIVDRLPMIGLFNHVLVRAHIGGKEYWLDGTRNGDTDVESIETPDFGWGLPVVDHAQLVSMVPRPLDKPNAEHLVNIDASGGVFAPATIGIGEVYRGDAAVLLNTAFSSVTGAQRDEAMRNKAGGYFDDFTVSSSSVQFDKAKREFRIDINGTAKLNWKDGWFYVPTSSIAFNPDFHRSAGPLHDVPVAVNHPRFTMDKVTVSLPHGFAAAQKLAPAVHETLAGVEYVRSESVDGDKLTVVSTERSLVAEVPYKDALSAEAKLRALDKDDVYLSSAVSYQATGKDVAALASASPTSADEFLDRGNLYLNSGKYDAAISDFTGALKLEPKNVWALADRGAAHVWKREFDEAEKDLAAAAAEDPDNSVMLRARGLIAELNSDCAKAIDYYTRSLATESGNAFTLSHRAECELSLSKFDAALADTAAILKADPSHTEVRVLRANIYMNQGKRDLVAAEADAMTRGDPESGFAWVAAGKTYAAVGEREQARKALDRAIAIRPEAYVYLNRADVREDTDLAGRKADIDAALKLDPKSVDALLSKAKLLTTSGDLKSARQVLERVKPEPEDRYAQVQKGVLLYKADRPEEAQKLLQKARDLSKSAAELNNLCWVKATAGIMLESALQDCRDSLKLGPDDGATKDSLGMVLLKLGKLDDALQAYDEALAVKTRAASLMGRAFVYLRKGDLARADADAAAARKMAPNIDDIFATYGLKFDRGAASVNTAAVAK
ncbi:MAG: DUF3857 domain-containing protein [Sphingomicrobium sp.]